MQAEFIAMVAVVNRCRLPLAVCCAADFAVLVAAVPVPVVLVAAVQMAAV